MNTTFGEAKATDNLGSIWELRVLDGPTLALTFLNSVFETCEIEESGAKIPYAEGALSLGGSFHFPILTQGSTIEIWLGDDSNPPHRAFLGILEYVDTSAEQGGPTKIVFQARGLAAALVDAAFKGETGPTVASVVTQLAEAAGLRASTKYPEVALSAWVNGQSSYGVLRLLGANLGAVVRTPDDLVEFLSNEAYLARTQGSPAFRLNTEDVQSSRTVQGQPVKR